MKHIILIIIIFLINATLTVAQSDKIARITNFGTAQIALPQFDDYKECYLEPTVKTIADGLEVPANQVLGFYLNQEIYNKRDSLGTISFDDCFKIYGTKQIQNYEADTSNLSEMRKLLKTSFIAENWNKMKKEIDKIGLEVKIGAPVLIKEYSHNENSFTYILLTKYEFPDETPYVLAMTLNGILLNKRLIWMAYYLNYAGEQTIDILEQQNKFLIQEIIHQNNYGK